MTQKVLYRNRIKPLINLAFLNKFLMVKKIDLAMLLCFILQFCSIKVI